MSAIPTTFRAYVAERLPDKVDAGIRTLAEADLPFGEVEIRVHWSDVNYKDALATRFDGKVARTSPLVPGIDLAGEVISSADPAFRVGQEVVAHGYDLGVARHGGYADFARVPALWVVPLPAGMTLREAMVLGTAGFTAALSVKRLEDRGLRPEHGPLWASVGSFVIGIGMGLCNTVFIVSIQASVPWRQRGAATSSSMFLRFVGQAVGAAGCGAVLNFTMLRIDPDAARAVDRLLDVVARVALPPAEIARLTDIVARSLHNAYWLTLILALITLLISQGLPARLSSRTQLKPD